MIEQLTADEKAFDIGYDDCMAGYKDCQNDNEDKSE